VRVVAAGEQRHTDGDEEQADASGGQHPLLGRRLADPVGVLGGDQGGGAAVVIPGIDAERAEPLVGRADRQDGSGGDEEQSERDRHEPDVLASSQSDLHHSQVGRVIGRMHQDL